MTSHEERESLPEEACEAIALVGRATRRVIGRLGQTPDDRASTSPDEHLAHDAGSFQAALEAILFGDDPAAAVSTLPTTAVPLVALVRGELLRDEQGSPEHVLGAVRALERLDHVWRHGAADDGEADLRAWLARPDAFELLVSLAHDLRSPLNSIIFLSETVRNADTGAFTDVQHRQLGLIYIAALGLNTVLSDVVELALDARDLVDEYEATEFWVGEVFDEVARMLAPMSEEKGVELRLDVGDDDRWFGHPMALSRILLNLATNGLKFTEAGHVEIGIRRVGPTTAEFFVSDTGRGIPDQQLAELFRPFRARARERSHYFSSSGLGLSICQRYLRAMGSTLEVQTEPGEGTRFFFRLESPSGR